MEPTSWLVSGNANPALVENYLWRSAQDSTSDESPPGLLHQQRMSVQSLVWISIALCLVAVALILLRIAQRSRRR